jgi:hypothetical protein
MYSLSLLFHPLYQHRRINSFLLNPSKRNINEICIITFNCALLHFSSPGSYPQAKYNIPIANYRIACYIITALELDSYIHIQYCKTWIYTIVKDKSFKIEMSYIINIINNTIVSHVR